MDSGSVLVLDGGTVLEQGPPAELLEARSGTFRAMVDAAKRTRGGGEDGN